MNKLLGSSLDAKAISHVAAANYAYKLEPVERVSRVWSCESACLYSLRVSGRRSYLDFGRADQRFNFEINFKISQFLG